MDAFVRQQLGKVKWAVLPPIDDNTTEFIIHRHAKPVLAVGTFYIIEIADWILNPSETLSLASNWNKGAVPQHKYMRCQVQQIMGNMIKIGCVAYDMDTGLDNYEEMYDGLWLPVTGFKLLEQLN